MEAAKILKSLKASSGLLPDLIERSAGDVKSLDDQMKALKRAGLIYASPHWREGKYFYLIHPTTAEGRKREYVGTDPKRIEQAMAAIERAKQYDELRQQFDQRARELGRIERELQYLVSALDG